MAVSLTALVLAAPIRADIIPRGQRSLRHEIVLEGLHQHSVLSKDQSSGQSAYTDMVAGMWEDIDGKGPVR